MKWLSTHYKVFSSLLLCWFVSFSLNSFASTQPITAWFGGGSYNGSSSQSLCTSLGYTYFTGGFHQTVNPGAFYVSGQGYFHTFNGAEFGWCTNFQGSTNGMQVYEADKCPDDGLGYVMLGGRMKCGSGPLQDDCPAAGTKKSQNVAVSGLSGQQGIGASMCADSGNTTCAMTCNSGIASYNEVSGQSSVYCESYTFSGSQCSNNAPVASAVTDVPTQNQATPVNNPPKSKQDCPGGSGFAEVNNKGMCLPGGTTVTGQSTTQTSTGGGSVSTTSTTTVNNNGTNSTTTITTYKDANGIVTYSGTGISTDGINQAGTQGNNEKPNLGDAPTFDSTLPSEATFNIKAQGNPVFSTEIFQTTASCPPDINYSVMGRDLSISFSSLCAFADVIRGIILMLSALVSMRVVVTQ